MLVYLDSAQFAWIERLDSASRANFYAAWQSRGFELAISMTHLQEMLQLSGELELRRRLQVLLPFPILRGLPASAGGVRFFEAEMQLRGCLGDPVDFISEARERFFPLTSFAELQDTLSDFSEDFRGFSDMAQLSAEGTQFVKQVRSIPKGPEVPFDADKARRAIGSLTEGMALSRPEMQTRYESIGAAVVGSLEEAEGNVRQAKEKHFGLTDARVVGSIPDEDLSAASSLFAAATYLAPEIAKQLGATVENVMSCVNDIDPYLAPGFRLQLAVQRARIRHPKSANAADETDQDHVVFAPYVDFFVADRRTWQFAREDEGKDRRLPPGSTATVRRVSTLDDLMTQLEALTSALPPQDA